MLQLAKCSSALVALLTLFEGDVAHHDQHHDHHHHHQNEPLD